MLAKHGRNSPSDYTLAAYKIQILKWSGKKYIYITKTTIFQIFEKANMARSP